MTTHCPKCGSRNLRFSRLRTPGERLRVLLGVRPIRCRDCRTRFRGRTWRINDLRFARCPKCLRMDLTLWSMSHYRASALKSFLVYLGANPYRCQYCRCNFVSLRRRKYKFSFRNNMQEKKTGSEEAATAQMDGSRET